MAPLRIALTTIVFSEVFWIIISSVHLKMKPNWKILGTNEALVTSCNLECSFS